MQFQLAIERHLFGNESLAVHHVECLDAQGVESSIDLDGSSSLSEPIKKRVKSWRTSECSIPIAHRRPHRGAHRRVHSRAPQPPRRRAWGLHLPQRPW